MKKLLITLIIISFCSCKASRPIAVHKPKEKPTMKLRINWLDMAMIGMWGGISYKALDKSFNK